MFGISSDDGQSIEQGGRRNEFVQNILRVRHTDFSQRRATSQSASMILSAYSRETSVVCAHKIEIAADWEKSAGTPPGRASVALQASGAIWPGAPRFGAAPICRCATLQGIDQ